MIWFDLLCLTPLSTISWRPVLVVEEAGVPEENHRLWQATGKLYHLRLRVECTPPSSTNKTGRHDIAEILLKLALSTIHITIKSFLMETIVFLLLPFPDEESWWFKYCTKNPRTVLTKSKNNNTRKNPYFIYTGNNYIN